MTVNYAPKIGNVKTSFLFTATTVDNKVIEINRNIGPISALPNMTLEGYAIGACGDLKRLVYSRMRSNWHNCRKLMVHV